MATKAWKAKQKRREALQDKFFEQRKQLKKEGNYAALANLPRDSSPTRGKNRCELTGRARAYLRRGATPPRSSTGRSSPAAPTGGG